MPSSHHLEDLQKYGEDAQNQDDEYDSEED